MAAIERPHRKYTYDEYLAIELDSTIKHELYDGEIYAMAGASLNHAALSANVIVALALACKGRGRRVHTSDLRIYLEKVGLATYPDASVICGPAQHHEPDPKGTVTNPTILVEVTSPSSDWYDLGFKADVYRMIPSLREYIIVSHRERCITVHRRAPAGDWTRQVATTGEHVAIPSLAAELSVDEIYDDIALD